MAVTTAAKPGLWNVQKGLVAPEWQSVWDKLNSAYLMNEGGSTTLHSVVQQRNDAQFINDPAWVGGTLGPEIEFDGGDDYVIQDNLLGDLDDFTVVVAFSTTTTSAGKVFGIVNNGSNEIINFELNIDETATASTSSMFWQVRRTGSLVRNVSYNDSTWRDGAIHVHAVTRKDGNTKMYLDEAEKVLSVGSDTLDSSTLGLDEVAMTIAAWNLRGTVGNFAVMNATFWGLWNRELNGGEIAVFTPELFEPFRMAPRRGVKAAAVGGATPKGPLGHPFHGPFAGPIAA